MIQYIMMHHNIIVNEPALLYVISFAHLTNSCEIFTVMRFECVAWSMLSAKGKCVISDVHTAYRQHTAVCSTYSHQSHGDIFPDV